MSDVYLTFIHSKSFYRRATEIGSVVCYMWLRFSNSDNSSSLLTFKNWTMKSCGNVP